MLSWGDLLYTLWIYSLDQGLNLWARSLICRLRGFAALLSLLSYFQPPMSYQCGGITWNVNICLMFPLKHLARKGLTMWQLSLWDKVWNRGWSVVGRWKHHFILHCKVSYFPAICLGTRNKIPDSKVHGANMGPNWVLSSPNGPHVGPMSLALRDTCILTNCDKTMCCRVVVNKM